jgi:Co/Zn/Cd efflux system component
LFSDIRASDYWRIFRSQGLIADGIHSLSDLVSDFVVLLLIIKVKIPMMTITTGIIVMKMVHH